MWCLDPLCRIQAMICLKVTNVNLLLPAWLTPGNLTRMGNERTGTHTYIQKGWDRMGCNLSNGVAPPTQPHCVHYIHQEKAGLASLSSGLCRGEVSGCSHPEREYCSSQLLYTHSWTTGSLCQFPLVQCIGPSQ